MVPQFAIKKDVTEVIFFRALIFVHTSFSLFHALVLHIIFFLFISSYHIIIFLYLSLHSIYFFLSSGGLKFECIRIILLFFFFIITPIFYISKKRIMLTWYPKSIKGMIFFNVKKIEYTIFFKIIFLYQLRALFSIFVKKIS